MASSLARRLLIAAAVIAALIIVYAAAGIWGLPYLLKTQAEKFAAQTLKRQASFGEVNCNPFLLALEIKDFALNEADGTPIAGAKRLFVDYELWPLLRKTIAFKDIVLEQPRVNLAIERNGSVNLARLAADLPKSEEEAPKAKGVPLVQIGRLDIGGAAFDFSDARVAPAFAAKIAPLSILLTDFSTLPDKEGKYELVAATPDGGKLKWKGEISLVPISSTATLELSGLSLVKLWSYFQDRLNFDLRSGTADLSLAYAFDYSGTAPQLQVSNGALTVRAIDLRGGADKRPDLALASLAVSDAAADLAKREASIGWIVLDKGSVVIQRGADQSINWTRLLQIKPDQRKPIVIPGEPDATAQPTPQAASGPQDWKLAIGDVRVRDIGATFIDDGARSPYALTVGPNALDLSVRAEVRPEGTQVLVDGIKVQLKDIALEPKGEERPILSLASAALGEGRLDSKAQTAQFDVLRLQGGLVRAWLDKDKQLNWLGMLPASGASASAELAKAAAEAQPRPAAKRKSAPSKAAASKRKGRRSTPPAPPTKQETPAQPQWNAKIDAIVLEEFTVEAADRSGAKPVQVDLQNVRASLKGVSTDLTKPVAFDAGLSVKQGGELTLLGSAVPGNPSAQGKFKLGNLALDPAQTYINQFAMLDLVAGDVSATGTFAYGIPKAKSRLEVKTDVRVAKLDLREEKTKERFLGWSTLDLERVSLGLEPNKLEIADVVLSRPDGQFIIYADRSLNIQRIQRGYVPAKPATADATAEAAAPKAEFVWSSKKAERKPAKTQASSAAERQAAELHDRFPMSIRRIKISNARMLFSDLSSQPQFSTRIHSMNGNVTGLSSRPNSKAQLKLEGSVDEFGLARFEGGLNPLAAKKYTDITATFRNLELTKVTPYSARFAGRRIASGKLDADLKYSIDNSQLEGANKFVIDNLELGERVDSPDAINLPLDFALALLKDSDGVIDLDLPVTGSLDDPEFSYGAIVWKAIVNLLTKIVTAPFRALGAMLGMSGGDQLDSVAFDPGSERILPPEKEKLKKLASVLSKRPQLKMSIKAGYAEQDAQAIKSLRVRTELAKKLGLKLEPGEDPGQIDTADEKAGDAIESLYRERVGRKELNQVIEELEKAAGGGKEPTREQRKQARAKLPEALLARLIEREPLADEELKTLAARRAELLQQELVATNAIAPERVTVAPIEKLDLGDKKMVTATFGLAAK